MYEDLIGGISEAQAALIAAGLSVLTVLVNLVVTVSASRGDARRAAYREALTPHLGLLGSSLHQVAACTRVMGKRYRSNQDASEWENRARIAKQDLEDVRLKTIYILPGFRDVLRSAALLPDKIATFKNLDVAAQESLLLCSAKFIDRLNKEILRAFKSGKVPSAASRWRVRFAERRVQTVWSKRRTY